MAAYQAQSGSDDLPSADGYVAASAAHPGRPEVLTAWMVGAVVDENDPVTQRPGPGPVHPIRLRSDADFVAQYRAAQEALITRSPTGPRTNWPRCARPGFSDRPFTVLRTWADPRMRSTPPSRPPAAEPNMCVTPALPIQANRSARGIAAATLRNWLGMCKVCGGRPERGPNRIGTHRM